jgi:peptidoglycan hydrolase CwlO-like protein
VNSSALAEWSLFAFGVIATLVGVVVSRRVSDLFKGKSVEHVVDTANSIIEMKDSHIGALETRVGALEKEIASLTAKLDETLKHNTTLQALLMASPAITPPVSPP